MLYTTDKTTLPGLDGKTYSLQAPLVRSPGRPAGGWRVTFPAGGQTLTADGRTPVEVYNTFRVLLKNNGVEVSSADIWLGLNIQWLNRTPDKYQMVPLSDVLAASRVRGQAGPADTRRRSYKPADWGALAWGWLNLFLAREEFHFRDFLTQLAYVLDLLNPDTNPEMGCAECYRDFHLAVDGLRKHPETDREGARLWLVRAHNKVSEKVKKRTLTFEQAAKKAFWT